MTPTGAQGTAGTIRAGGMNPDRLLDPSLPDEALLDRPVSAAEPHLASMYGGSANRDHPSLISDYMSFFKIRVTTMVMIAAWAGYYLASAQSGSSSLHWSLPAALLGIGLVSGGSVAMNEILERNADGKMQRTVGRPLVSGRMSLAHGMIAGLGAMAIGSLLLAWFTNLLTVELILLTAFAYVLVYTPLKRRSSLATFIGAIPGAMPPLLGWTAATGRIDTPAIALFAILFVWQFPHFMSISWLYREDYARAGIRMLPAVEPDGGSTVAEAVTYALLMIPVSLVPFYLGIAGKAYAVAAILLGLGYLGFALRFSGILHAATEKESRRYAYELLKASVIYLPLLLGTMMLSAITGR